MDLSKITLKTQIMYLYHDPKNPNAHLTVKERDKPSYPTRVLLRQNVLKGKILDFGCGLGKDVEFLKEKGFDIQGYDPYYAPEYPTEKFDTIICHYVLNVLFPKEQTYVLMSVSELLKPTGKAYFTVRRDLKKEGFRTHFIHQVPTYQCNVRLNYKSYFKTEFCEIYEYQHFNQIIKDSDCVFCSPDAERELITESATMYAILDKYPVSQGHILIISKSHKSDYFDLVEKEKRALLLMVDRVKLLLDKRYNPDGYNLGVNCGEAAGQTIPHFHYHLIPRYKGDTPNPKGGIRHCITGKGDYP